MFEWNLGPLLDRNRPMEGNSIPCSEDGMSWRPFFSIPMTTWQTETEAVDRI